MIIRQIKDTLISELQDNSNEILDKIYLWIYLAKKQLQNYNFSWNKKEYKETVNNKEYINLPGDFEKIEKVYLDETQIYEKKSNYRNNTVYDITRGKIELEIPSQVIVSSDSTEEDTGINIKGDVEEYIELKGEKITDENIGVGTGSQTVFSGTLENYPIKENTLEIHYTIGANNYTAEDDGDGNITGDNIISGAIDYDTGDWTITFDTAVDNGTTIFADYDKATIVTTNKTFSYIENITKGKSEGKITIKDTSDNIIWTTEDLNVVEYFIKAIRFNKEISGEIKITYYEKIRYTTNDYESDEWTYRYGDLIVMYCLWRGFSFQNDMQLSNYYFQLFQGKLKEAITEDRRESKKNVSMIFKRE